MVKLWAVIMETVFIVLISQHQAMSNVIVAESCSQTHVQAAVNAAQEGSTVLVPSGICQWSQPVTLGKVISSSIKTYESKGIVITGSGIGKTILTNTSIKNASLFSMITVSGKSLRITGFTFKDTGIKYPSSKGMIAIGGTGKSWRIDHCQFDHLGGFSIVVNGDTSGVLDHSEFLMKWSTIAIAVYHGEWNNAQFGDGSWASPLNLGSPRAIFIEDNAFTFEWDGNTNHKHAWSVDSSEGGRYVFRYNKLKNVVLANHGTDTGQNRRGNFSFEIYYNTFSRDIESPYPNAIMLRGGTGVIWGNTATGSWKNFARASRFRRFYTTTSWSGACDGEGPYDLNDGIVYEKGAHEGPDTGIADPYIYSNAKSWPTDTWSGYSVINTTRNVSGYIASNTTNTITVTPSPRDQRSGHFFMNNGDKYKIMKPLACVDQVGRSTGNLLSGRPASPSGWPNQALEPVYLWGNTLNGTAAVMFIDDTGLKNGTDFLNGVQRPLYTPYAYPHPLTVISNDTSSQSMGTILSNNSATRAAGEINNNK